MPSCSRKECFIESFDVVVNRTVDTLTFTVDDDCNALTSCRLIKQVLLNALAQFLANATNSEVANDLTANTTGCDCACGYQEIEYVFDTLSMSFDITHAATTTADSDDVVITVTLPL
jgi:hypothetical protein